MAKNDQTNQGKIKVTKNGPYVVSGGVPLNEKIIVTDAEGFSHSWHRGKQFSAGEKYALCRCGGSKNKPFCDGTHLTNNFDGAETAPAKACARRIEGPGLDLIDAESLCANARFCDRAGGINHLIEKSGDNASRQVAIEEACNCPSGRLVVEEKEGKVIEPELEPSVALVQDPSQGVSGPLWVQSNIPVESAAGAAYEVRNRVTLCRCGHSKNKPFCDGKHIEARFSDGSDAL